MNFFKKTIARLPEEVRFLKGFLRACLVPAHSHLLGASFILSWYGQRIHLLDLSIVAVVTLTVFLLTLLVRAGCLLVVANVNKAAIIASILLFLLLFFGDVRNYYMVVISGIDWRWTFRTRYQLLLWGGSTLGLSLVIFFIKSTFKRTNFALTAVTLVVLIQMVAKVIFHNEWPQFAPPQLTGVPHMNPSTNQMPDIFFIISDCHASSTNLQKFWNYDDQQFRDGLEKRGFQVAQNAHSDFDFTIMCLATIFNMSRVNHTNNLRFVEQAGYLSHTIKNSLLAGVLADLGYDFHNFSLFEFGASTRLYRIFFIGGYYSAFKQTLPGSLLHDYNYRDYMADVNHQVMDRLTNLPVRSPGGRPRFVYGHLMLPHYPYVFDREGRRLPKPVDHIEKGAYLDQLIYTDTLLLEIVDKIKARHQPEPIIVIQGDHGFRFFFGPNRDEIAHGILMACHFPGLKQPLPENDLIRPVNTFRIILNQYFGGKIPLETNSVSESFKHFY
jgi:hypothetical protein